MQTRNNNSAKYRIGGFSLLEVLVAFSIMAISVGILLRIFSSASHTIGLGDDYSDAILVAESLLETIGIEKPVSTGKLSGLAHDRYRWTIDVKPYPIDQTLLISGASSSPAPYWVEVDVRWGSKRDERGFMLRSLRLIKKQQ